MQIYTLVSLIIGIFGATYAALNALKTNLEGKVKNADETAEERAQAYKGVRGPDNKGTIHCENHCKVIKRWYRCWKWCHTLPAFLFFGLIVFVAFFVLAEWHQLTAQMADAKLNEFRAEFPWNSMRGLLTFMFTTDMLCVGFAIVARHKCLSADSSLQELHDSAQPPKFEAPTGPAGATGPI